MFIDVKPRYESSMTSSASQQVPLWPLRTRICFHYNNQTHPRYTDFMYAKNHCGCVTLCHKKPSAFLISTWRPHQDPAQKPSSFCLILCHDRVVSLSERGPSKSYMFKRHVQHSFTNRLDVPWLGKLGLKNYCLSRKHNSESCDARSTTWEPPGVNLNSGSCLVPHNKDEHMLSGVRSACFV